MISKSKKWGLSTYITLILVISIIGKRVGIRLFFCRNSYTFQKFTMDHILFSYLSYDPRIHFRQSAYKVTDNFLTSFFTDQFRSIISH